MKEEDFKFLRKKMVEEQIIARGIKNQKVIECMLEIPRHKFVPESERDNAYGDYPLSIGNGQTISQPYMVALMTELLELKGNEKVLEIGTGSGYQTAILARLSKEVHTIERIEELSKNAEKVIKSLGIENVIFHIGDGSEGIESESPFDRIIVTAGAPSLPETLIRQLKDGGRMVVPVGTDIFQTLKIVEKKDRRINVINSIACTFVPLIGEFGWQEKK